MRVNRAGAQQLRRCTHIGAIRMRARRGPAKKPLKDLYRNDNLVFYLSHSRRHPRGILSLFALRP